jgi:glutathione S-transferase
MVKVCRSVGTQVVFLVCLVASGQGFLAPTPISKSPSLSPCASTNIPLIPFQATRVASFASAKILATMSMSSATATTIPSWADLQDSVASTLVGKALKTEVELRKTGAGSAHVHSTLRTFGSKEEPQITFYRDHAAWCPYCQKAMMLIEEKQIPIKISLVPMRSYGDKPREFLAKVPSGLLPAMEVNGQIITESQVIMELLDQWHPPEEGYRAMLPVKDDREGRAKYDQLARLERELFSWWCTLMFRPEGPRLGAGNPLSRLLGGGGDKDSSAMSGSMSGFMDCIKKVDAALLSTKGPWFFDTYDHPTMIDFVFVSHVERMLASCAYWKGLDMRDSKWNLKGLNGWLDAFEKREAYLAFKSDYLTHVKDIPPQYGPGNDGGFEEDRVKFSSSILGKDGSWHLPLPHDDPVQPLYRGVPLPICVLEAAGLTADADGSYLSCDEKAMEQACRFMAAWKLSGNGANVAKFAARGGPAGSKNPRKSFGAELADPYAAADEEVQASVDAALRIVCAALMDVETVSPADSMLNDLRAAVPAKHVEGVKSSLAYVRDRVGVPRDLPLAAARYFRAYLNWGIDSL